MSLVLQAASNRETARSQMSWSMFSRYHNKQNGNKCISLVATFVGFILFNLQVCQEIKWTLILIKNTHYERIIQHHLIPVNLALFTTLTMTTIDQVFLILIHPVFVIKYYTKLFCINTLYTFVSRIKYELDILIFIVLKYNSIHAISMYTHNYDKMIVDLYVLIQNKTGTVQINYIIIIIPTINEYTKYKWTLCIFLIFLFEKRLHLLFQLPICNYVTYSMIIRAYLYLIMLLLFINFIFQTINNYNCQISRIKHNTSDYNEYCDRTSRIIAKTKIKNGFSSQMAIFMIQNTWYNVKYYAILLYLHIMSRIMQKNSSKITLLIIFYIIYQYMVNHNKLDIFTYGKRVSQETLKLMINFTENTYGSYRLLLLVVMLLYMLLMIQKEKLEKVHFMALKIALEFAWCILTMGKKTKTETEKQKHVLFEKFSFLIMIKNNNRTTTTQSWCIGMYY